MRKVTTVSIAVMAVIALSGCAQTGMFASGHLTAVELAEPNYEVVATGVSGQSKAAYLVGVSFSNGAQSGSLSLFRVDGSGKLYKEAMEGLWESFEKEHGAAEGRRLALANVRYDAETRNFLVYNSIALSIRADVIEFTDD
jgi:hypothetical protein